MDFRYTDDQQDLIDAAKAVFDGENTLERMRAMVAGEDVTDLWPQFAELGLLGIMASEDQGGLEQDLSVMAGIAEAAGYAGLPEPLVEVAGISVPVLNEVEDLISGKSRDIVPSSLRPYAPGEGDSVKSIDPLRKLVKTTASDAGPELAQYHGAVLTAAQLLGLASRMIDMSVEYAKDRHQFGKPIGSFQAIKHHLATAYTQVEFARPLVQLAACQGDRVVHEAKVAAIDAAMLAGETAIQVHGGMGYTFEVDLHLFMKRAWAICAEWGDRNYHMKKLEDLILDGDEALGPGTTFMT